LIEACWNVAGFCVPSWTISWASFFSLNKPSVKQTFPSLDKCLSLNEWASSDMFMAVAGDVLFESSSSYDFLFLTSSTKYHVEINPASPNITTPSFLFGRIDHFPQWRICPLRDQNLRAGTTFSPLSPPPPGSGRFSSSPVVWSFFRPPPLIFFAESLITVIKRRAPLPPLGVFPFPPPFFPPPLGHQPCG